MNSGNETKKTFHRLHSFDIWDEEHDNAPPAIKILITTFRLIRIIFREFREDRLFLKGMALTFATIISIVPLLVISFSVFKMFGGGEWFNKVVHPFILTNLAPGSGPIVAQRLQQLIDNAGSVAYGGIGVVLLLLAVYGIFAGIETIFNGIWDVKAPNRGFRRLPLYWGFVTIIPVLVIGSLALSGYIQALPIVHHAVERITFAQTVMDKLLPWLMMVMGFFLLYRFLPNISVRTRTALSGALVAGLLYETVKFGFIIYTTKLVQYDVIYGSLAILPMLLIWINLSWFVVLLGVEVSFVAQHYEILVSKSKHVTFARWQKDALAYLILFETTKAFQGLRQNVILSEWSDKYKIPPSIVEAVVERLRKGGLIERAGSTGEKLLLTKNPDTTSLVDIENVISNQTGEQWSCPDNENWNWVKAWMAVRQQASWEASKYQTLGEVVSQLQNNASH